VDSRANAAQRAALVKLAQQQGGELVRNVVSVETAKVDLDICACAEGGCAKLKAGHATIETRCLDHKNDKICGSESAYYPPLTRGVTAKAAVAVEHRFDGKGINETWLDSGRRGAYLGTFEAR
jgi:hypothetical protein